MKFAAIPNREVSEVTIAAELRIVRWEPSFVTTPFVDTGDGLHISRAPNDEHHRYRGTCIERGELHGIWQPLAA